MVGDVIQKVCTINCIYCCPRPFVIHYFGIYDGKFLAVSLMEESLGFI